MILKSLNLDHNFFITKNPRLTNIKWTDHYGSNRLTEKKTLLNSQPVPNMAKLTCFCFRPILYVWPLQINLSFEEIFWLDKLLKSTFCELASVSSISSSLGSENFLAARTRWLEFYVPLRSFVSKKCFIFIIRSSHGLNCLNFLQTFCFNNFELVSQDLIVIEVTQSSK